MIQRPSPNTGIYEEGIFFPFLIHSFSDDRTTYLSRNNSSLSNLDNSNTIIDTKFNQMMIKTTYCNILYKTELLLQTIQNGNYFPLSNDQMYFKLSAFLFDIMKIVNDSVYAKSNKDDYLKALMYQQIIIDIMINVLQSKLNVFSDHNL
jgi:hypothetical protein